MATILITGATGYLGSQLIKYITDTSATKVIGLKRSTSSLTRLEPVLDKIKLYDVKNMPMLFEENEIDCIIHTATCYGRNQESNLDIIDANLLFPLKLIDTYFKAHTDKEIQPLKFINIDTILQKDANPYSLSKKQLLDWLEFFSNNKKLIINNIALHYMYGPQDDATKYTSYVIQQCLQNIESIDLSHGQQRKDFIFIDDVVSAIVKVMNHSDAKPFTTFELGTGKFWSVREYAEIVHRLSDSSSKLNFGAIPSRSNEQDGMAANINKLQALGWQPQYDLPAGLSETINRELI